MVYKYQNSFGDDISLNSFFLDITLCSLGLCFSGQAHIQLITGTSMQVIVYIIFDDIKSLVCIRSLEADVKQSRLKDSSDAHALFIEATISSNTSLNVQLYLRDTL